jgi:hypothetical protein
MKLRTSTFLLALALFGSDNVRAETNEPITIAVLNVAGPRRTLANNISALLTVNLSADPRFSLVDRNELDKVLKEQSLGSSGNITPETAARIGQLTGAKVLITGREFSPNSGNDIVVIANVIGTETGRVFSHTEQGTGTGVVDLVAKLSGKIAQTIGEQTTNLVARPAEAGSQRLNRIIEQTKGRKLPSVSVRIKETIGDGGESKTAETELGLILRKAGFTLLDEKSKQQPDIRITGDAITGRMEKRDDLFSCPATVAIKVQERKSGKILSLDLQRGVAADVGEPTAARKALESAADGLAERLIPALAQ